MSVKKHLEGGTLRAVMVAEIKRVLAASANSSQPLEQAALTLGITPRTLRVWRGPVSKGGWEELQPKVEEAIEAIAAVTEVKRNKREKKH